MKYLRILVVILFVIYLGFQTYTFLKIQSGDEMDTRCGTVTFKGNRDQVNKHSTNTEFIMVILYDDTHMKEDETVRAATWSSYNVGDRICLSWSVDVGQRMGIINLTLGAIGSFVFAFGTIAFVVILLIWFFTGNSPFTADFWKD